VFPAVRSHSRFQVKYSIFCYCSVVENTIRRHSQEMRCGCFVDRLFRMDSGNEVCRLGRPVANSPEKRCVRRSSYPRVSLWFSLRKTGVSFCSYLTSNIAVEPYCLVRPIFYTEGGVQNSSQGSSRTNPTERVSCIVRNRIPESIASEYISYSQDNRNAAEQRLTVFTLEKLSATAQDARDAYFDVSKHAIRTNFAR